MPESPLPEPRPGAYEIKFLVDDERADELLTRARQQLAADPHAEPARGDGYRIHSLYFDTADLAVFRRAGIHARRKLRLRRYGVEPLIYTERKAKLRGIVTKRRSAIDAEELEWLLDPRERPGWPAQWFRRRLGLRGLAPKVSVVYDRVARVGMTPEGPIRFTVDRGVRCLATSGPGFPPANEGQSVLEGLSVVEFKYRLAMPAVFKALIRELGLEPTGVSKYRHSVLTCGLHEQLGGERVERGEGLAAKLRTA
jgi:hypothetical protein